MTLPTPADDKIEALVGLVLQAVDQRMTTVREQLIELNNSVARRHGELGDQIAECRAMISSMASGTGSAGPGAVAGSDPAADAAAAQLLQAANTLTERVAFLESRVNQYTDDRVAELRSAFEQMVSAPAPSGQRLGEAVAPLVPRSRGIAQLGSLPAVASRAAPSNLAQAALDAVPTVPAPAAAAAPVAPASADAAEAPAAAATTAPTLAEFDIDAFTARFNARLSALVERAIDG